MLLLSLKTLDRSKLLTSLISVATFTWTLPPPRRGPLQTSDASVRTTIQQVIIGSSVAQLAWNFTFSGETLDRVTFKIGATRIGRKSSSGIAIDPILNFQEHFDISSSDPATLIIYNATEADEVVFSCIVETNIKEWTDEIEVQIVGKFMKNMLVFELFYYSGVLCYIFFKNKEADETMFLARFEIKSNVKIL